MDGRLELLKIRYCVETDFSHRQTFGDRHVPGRILTDGHVKTIFWIQVMNQMTFANFVVFFIGWESVMQMEHLLPCFPLAGDWGVD